jgi:hypothetical protein
MFSENLQIQYRLEMFDSGLNVEKENSGLFSKYILSVYPHVKIEHLTQGNDRKSFYVGIELKPLLAFTYFDLLNSFQNNRNVFFCKLVGITYQQRI